MAGATPLNKTPLFDWHQANGGRIVDFGGWLLPVQYHSIIEEHRAVRERVGLFDISHMGRLTLHGPGALEWLESATTNQVSSLAVGQIQYSLMTNDAGGVLDDVLVYRTPHSHVMVCNASNRGKVVAQLDRLRPKSEAVFHDGTLETAMIAVQGPGALETLQPISSVALESLKYYWNEPATVAGAEGVVSRTGYTGEDGFEVVVAAGKAEAVWTALLESGRRLGITPCGLGARDTLRFEAGMPLYGHELLETINPFEAGLGMFVKLDKGEFVGRDALRGLKSNVKRKRIGLTLAGKRIARQGYPVLRDGQRVGEVTSGTFAPTLNASLAMALVDISAAAPGTELAVDVRGHAEPAQACRLPFYRRPHPNPAH